MWKVFRGRISQTENKFVLLNIEKKLEYYSFFGYLPIGTNTDILVQKL